MEQFNNKLVFRFGRDVPDKDAQYDLGILATIRMGLHLKAVMTGSMSPEEESMRSRLDMSRKSGATSFAIDREEVEPVLEGITYALAADRQEFALYRRLGDKSFDAAILDADHLATDAARSSLSAIERLATFGYAINYAAHLAHLQAAVDSEG